MIASAIDSISAIPNVVWSGLLASLITLSGVMISNASNTNRLLKQLTHDAEQKERDRLNGLRRDVYLKAAEEAVKVGGHFGKIPTIDPSTTNLGDVLSDFLSASTKLQLVSQPETARVAGELTTRYGEIFFMLLEKASPIHSLNTQIRITGDFYNKNQSEVDRIFSEIKKINESSNHDAEKIAALERSLKQSQEAADYFLKEREIAFESHSKAMDSYMATLMEQTQSTLSIQNELMICIRKEFNLSMDKDASRAVSEKNFKRVSAAMQKMINYLKSDK